MPLSAGMRLGPYEILSSLGKGGMGEVYRARDQRLGREVALKVLPSELSAEPQRLKYFEQEARAASALNHPNIITIYEIGQADGTQYTAMELVEGKTLRKLLAAGPLPSKQMLQIAAQIAGGLAKAHAAGIVHRDLKPENLMVTKEGLVKILDFGIAKLTQPDVLPRTGSETATLTSRTEPGVIVGTAGYMSPEQASGLPVDFRSDQFSFGAVLYEMATGKRAFQRETFVETLSAIIRDEPQPVPEINPKAPAPAIQAISSTEEMAVILECTWAFGSCQGTLAQVPLAGGAPREILEDVVSADWGPDGKTLAVVHAAQGRYRLEYPIGKVLYETAGWITLARVSPKGDLIAFFDHPTVEGVDGSVYAVDLTGRKKTLSAGWKLLSGLAWSPKGDEVWFAGSRRAISTGLYAVTPSGQERVVFLGPGSISLNDVSRDGHVLVGRGAPRSRMICQPPGAAKEVDLSWFDWSTAADLSPNGKTVLFREWGEALGGAQTVYLRKTDGSDAVRLGQGKALALSPDGKWALTLQVTRPQQLVLLPTGPGDPKPLPRGHIAEYDLAAWFPDGNRVLLVGEEPGHPPRSYIQEVDGGDPRPFLEERLLATLASPDGNLVAAKGPQDQYYLCRLDGGEPKEIPGLAAGEVPIQWSADGRSLYVRASGKTAAEIYRIELSTGHRQLWKELRPDLVGLVAIDDVIRLAPDGKSYVYTYWTGSDELFLVDGLK